MGNFWIDKFGETPRGLMFVSVSGSKPFLVSVTENTLEYVADEKDPEFNEFWLTFQLLWRTEGELCFHTEAGPLYSWVSFDNIVYKYHGMGPWVPARLQFTVTFSVRD